MLHRETATELESVVRQTLPFLFTDHGAQLVCSETLPGAGNGQVFVRLHDIELRVIQKSGSLDVLAAPRHKPNGWQAIELLLEAADPKTKFLPPPVYGSLAELSSLLEPRLLLLNTALSPDHFDLTILNSRQVALKGLITIGPRTPVSMPVWKRVLIGVVGGIVRLIQFLIPRSRDAYAKTMPIGNDVELDESVRREFGFLFKQHGAKVSSNGRLGIMDFACVTVDAGNLRLRAARDRGSVEIAIAPVHAIRYWQNFGEALMAVQPGTEMPQSVPSSILRGAGRRLEVEFAKLNEAFSQAQYPATLERIREIRATLENAWIEDWNRKSTHLRAARSEHQAIDGGPNSR